MTNLQSSRTYRKGALLFVITPTGRHLRVTTRTVGSRFGTVGLLLDGATVVAEGEVRPYNFIDAAVTDAIDLASRY
jgi:hypothetical protein